MGTTTSKVSTTSLTALPGKLSGAQGALAGITSEARLLAIRLNSAILTDKLTADVLGKVLLANDTLDPQGGSGAIEGADTIGAEAGVYTLIGGKEADTCVFTPTSDSALDALDTIALAKAW
ncbi:hypothetical protein [Pseudomonas sp. MS15a(2019)]|uniref:hypothetical protein n=1 Tax=Pseudomonas sp. MS15a(2019) TaxID=2579938 RepID=UPI0015643AD1|nr:hypothetical protein [Pseudomonas sp. MS15a(2019)]NRH43907.1 hypothetical protein [Pseudomonas sp. MS15a(2019)]